MNLILFDDHSWSNLLPLTYTKPAAELRVGILTIKEKWEKQMATKASFLTKDYLQSKYSIKISAENLLINGTLLPSPDLLKAILDLQKNQALKKGDTLLAVNTILDDFNLNDPDLLNKADEYPGEIDLIDYPWKIFSLNGQEISADFALITSGRKSSRLSDSVNIIGENEIFAEEGFKAECITLNSTAGPIYLGKDSEIMEGSLIRGPFSLGDHSVVKMAAKIYGPTTIGPHCRAGGEINNSVFQAYSNKGHDGFLGNAVIGEWCNLGADTNNSNLKNNYAEVKVWNYPANRFIKTGLQFCGLIMGDHSKSAINTMFNTGTVVGVSTNIFGSGFPRNFLPSFSWGGAAGMIDYKVEKAFETMRLVMERRNIELTKKDMEIFEHIFKETEKYRK
jgi:UDP-N-acetylglucosamine diphosphorylase/glucosamine-1-phosphate N-acetyltransferase